ncbi:MAG TPA: LuxR C-terminal-related transcriptional regulator [Nocardioides sp.]|uniref:LuxR C-terminal-related transcriptional regulator n=1 Tax=Nocardioides sp. TaxID=35761 RepID=UPI002D7EB85A|nr:LuxR C-terminal-related transcriptional regulator [Nocardioides sp.]HET6651588.1 LuxR C-terminal-related transcriptional regulator [Nocardioides sp.]
MSTTVLATKLFAPTPRARLVARPRLAARLDRTFDDGNRLTLVSAPAGFGKTTLLTDWLDAASRQRPGTGTGWLSLDDGDNDLSRLLAHLAAALERTGLPLDRGVVAPMAADGSAALTALLNEIVRAGEQSPGTHRLLVLDDYHVLEAAEVHEAMAFLLDQLPDRLHLLLATRSDPVLPLARLRSRGQLTEVRAADLRFTPSEALEFLNRVMGLDLAADDVAALEDRTEGWIAGLQLAGLSLRDLPEREAVAGFIDAFTGSNRFVIDYLADEVLARQPPEVREFLLRTSVLDRLTGDLCDAVTGGSEGARVLEHLERGNLFLVPLDTDRSWYRYHHLFADVLLARLLAEQPDAVPGLHLSASAWYAAHGLVEDAVRHALAAPDHDRAAYLMEEALPEVRRARQDGLLLSWMRSLPDSVVRRSPVLSIVSGWSRLMSGDLDAMERRLDDAEAALAAGAEHPELAGTWADTEDLRLAPATIPVYRASLAQARGDVAGTVRHARQAMDLSGPEDHFVRGAGAGYLGLAAWAAGDIEEALPTFTEAVRHLHAAGNLVDELDSTIPLADMWVAAGQPGRARRLYDVALESATGGGPPYPRAAADLHVGLAELDRELNDLDSASEHLETARELGERASITENRHRWYVAMAQVRAALGDHDTVTQLLGQAAELYRHGFYPDVRPIPAMQARIHIAAGDLAAAEAWADDHGVPSAAAATYLREYDHLTFVRLLLARGGGERLRDAAILLDRLQADAEPNRAGSLLEIGVLRALVRHADGDRAEAFAGLDRALARAPEPEGYVRLFLDEGTPMLTLLRDAAGESGDTHDVLHRHARRLLEAVGTSRPARDVLPDPLSDRELDVLRLLDSELTGPEIARRLFVSLNTLRTHTKRIFTKLDVNNRAAAVRRARRLGLL